MPANIRRPLTNEDMGEPPMPRMLQMRITFLCLLLAIAGCKSPDTAVSDDVAVDCPQVLNESRSAGVDYVPTLRAAAKGDAKALSQLFQLTGSDHLDANAQQCHIEALAELLNRQGDQRFAAALAAESAEIRRAVVSGLILELDNLPTPCGTSATAPAGKWGQLSPPLQSSPATRPQSSSAHPPSSPH